MSAVIPVLLLLSAQADFGPSLPPRTSEFVVKAAYQSQLALAKSNFVLAAEELAKWPGKEITYDAAGLPDKYAPAVSAAAAMWVEASGERLKVVPKRDGFVKFVVVPFASAPKDPEFKDGRIVIELPLRIGGESGPPTSQYTATWIIAKALGMSLGLAPNLKRMHVTGPVLVTPEMPNAPKLSPDIAERSRLLTVLEAREAIEKAIAERKPMQPAEPRIEVDRTEVDGGVVEKGTRPRFEFKIANKGNAPLRLEFESSCHCLLVSPPQIVMPGKELKLTAELDTQDYTGRFEKVVQVFSNDPTKPNVPIRLTVISIPEFRVLPEGMPVVPLNDDGPTNYELTVYSTTDSDTFEVTNTQLSKPAFETNVLPFNGDVVDSIFGTTPKKRKGSLVKITIPESHPAGLDWLRVIIMTNTKSKRYADVTMQLAKGIYAQPKAVYYGAMNVGASDKRTVTVEHPTKRFAIKTVEVEGEGITVTHEPEGTAGRRYKVTVSITTKAVGQVAGKVTITTDSPKYPKIVLPVSALVE